MKQLLESSHTSTLVCVTNQFACERIIMMGRKIADLTQTTLAVLNVAGNFGYEKNHEALEFLFEVSKNHGAEMMVVYSENPFEAISDTIKKIHAVHIVTGVPRSEDSIIHKLMQRFPASTFYAVPEEEPSVKNS